MIILRKIDIAPDTLLDLTDTPSIYTEGKFLQSTTSGTEWTAVSGAGGTSFHSELYELDYSLAGHTGFSPTVHNHIESDITNLDKYTQLEVDTLISSASGTTNHSNLDNLDYMSSGHTGFQATGNYLTDTEFTTYSGTLQSQIDDKADTSHSHIETDISDLDKYTMSEVDTISGSLSSEIDSDISTHASNTDAHHDESHTVVSHSDTTATGAELDTLTDGSDTSLHIHDNRYYTESEVDTISGSLQTDIDGKSDDEHEHVELDISDLDKYTENEVDALIASASGTTDHSALNNLDYVSAGHTGFQPTGDYLTDAEFSTYSGTLQTQIDDKSDASHLHDNRYYTEDEVDTISGSLNTEIDSDISTHSSSTDHDGRYYTESEVDSLTWTESDITDLDKYTQSEVDTISGSLQTNIDGKSDTGHGHTASDVSDFSEATDDRVSNLLVAGDNISLDYNDDANTLTISGSASGGASTLLELTDTPSSYANGLYLKSTANGTEWSTTSGSGGVENHSALNELDYASAGHTGFSPDTHLHDSRYYTESEVDTASGTLQSQIYSNDDDITALKTINTDNKNPTGFINKTDSTLSFNDGTNELTISGTYSYYIEGTKYNVFIPKTTSILGQGINYFYLDSIGDLLVTQTFNADTLFKDNVYTAVVYWDNNDSKHVYFGDERHSIAWDWNSHSYHHLTEGTKYQSGFSLSGVNAFGPIEHIYNADSSLWVLSIVSSFPNDFVVSSAQNHTVGGSNSLDFSGSEDTDIVQFSKGSYVNLSDFNSINGWIYITTWGGGDNLQIYGYDSVNDIIVGSAVNLSNYVTIGTTDSWQEFNIPLVDAGLGSENIDSLRIEMIGVGQPPSGYLDDIALHYGPTASGIDLTFGVSSGIIRDEDLVHNISSIIKGNSDFIVLYREGDGGAWTHDGATDIIFKQYSGGSNRVAWNEYNTLSGTWGQTEVDNYEYTMVHLFATNDIEHPLVGVQAQSTFSDVSIARSEIIDDITSIVTGDMPFEEFLPIASLIVYCTDDIITNNYSAAFMYLDVEHTETWYDFRASRGASTGNISITNHGNLSGLGDDDHPQYLNSTRGNILYYTKSEVNTISGSLNIEIDSDISAHSSSADHDGRYYTESEVDDLITTVSGKLDDHDELNNLDYASAGHTGFSPTSHGHIESDISDLDKYTENEVDTISGSLQTQIDNITVSGGVNTFVDLNDTPSTYSGNEDKHVYVESAGTALNFRHISDNDSYTEITYNNAFPTQINVYTDSGKTHQTSSTAITRVSGIVTQTTKSIYDIDTGTSVVSTFTTTINRDNGRVVSTTSVRT